jgi:hypothetical protein
MYLHAVLMFLLGVLRQNFVFPGWSSYHTTESHPGRDTRPVLLELMPGLAVLCHSVRIMKKKPKNYSNYSEDSEGISHQDIHFR